MSIPKWPNVKTAVLIREYRAEKKFCIFIIDSYSWCGREDSNFQAVKAQRPQRCVYTIPPRPHMIFVRMYF